MRQRRIEQPRDLLGRGDVHRGREAVVRRLAHVDVIVRMHRRFRAELAAEHLVGAVGDHLVDVHVGLGAGAGLPDHQREMIVELAVDHLLRGLDDGARAPRVEQLERMIDLGRGALDDAERADQRAAACARCRCGNSRSSAGSARPSSGRPAPRSGRRCRSRSWCRALVPAFRGSGRLGHHFLRKRSSRTTSAPRLVRWAWLRLVRRRSRLRSAAGTRARAERWSAPAPGAAARRLLGRLSARSASISLGVLVRRFRQRLELQRELNRRIDENLDRLERHR